MIRDIEKDGAVVGRLLVHNPYLELQSKRDLKQALMIGALLLMMLIVSLGYFLYLRNRVVKPFDKMKSFATRVASGDLDTPLEMDRGHVFGAFTESFDIMREELAESKKREIELQRKEKELIASLSHDLKTPITGIKLTTELLEAKLNKYISEEPEKAESPIRVTYSGISAKTISLSAFIRTNSTTAPTVGHRFFIHLTTIRAVSLRNRSETPSYHCSRMITHVS